jgi:hypothetical protein
MDKSKYKIYTGVFLVDPIITKGKPAFALSKFHITYHYQPGDCRFPTNVEEDDWVSIHHHGIYDDGEILASKVSLLHHNSEGERQSILFQRRRYDPKNDDEFLAQYPLHITWSSGELPPVIAAERLSDDSLMDKYYTQTSQKPEFNESEWKYKKDVMVANDLNIDDEMNRKVYNARLNHIFGYLDPIGVWKTYSAPDEEKIDNSEEN